MLGDTAVGDDAAGAGRECERDPGFGGDGGEADTDGVQRRGGGGGVVTPNAAAPEGAVRVSTGENVTAAAQPCEVADLLSVRHLVPFGGVYGAAVRHPRLPWRR